MTQPFFQFNNLAAQPGVRHAITRRWRPATDGSPREFNLGYRATTFAPSDTAANWRYLAAALEIAPQGFVGAQQVHGGLVSRVGCDDWGAGIRLQAWGDPTEWRDDEPPGQQPIMGNDGLVTNEPHTWLVGVYADCTPLLAYDPRTRAVAVTHAGWRGTVAQIGAAMVAKMVAEFGSDPADILCGIGPAAGPCCYQVSQEVIDKVNATFPAEWGLLNHEGQPDGHAIFDLWAANRLTLQAAGVTPANIEVAGICTIHQAADFFSARSDGLAVAARFAAVIGLF